MIETNHVVTVSKFIASMLSQRIINNLTKPQDQTLETLGVVGKEIQDIPKMKQRIAIAVF